MDVVDSVFTARHEMEVVDRLAVFEAHGFAWGKIAEDACLAVDRCRQAAVQADIEIDGEDAVTGLGGGQGRCGAV